MESVDAETLSLIRALAHADVLIDEETNMTECIFCDNEMPDNPAGFMHDPSCPVIRACAWLRAHAVEGLPLIVVEA